MFEYSIYLDYSYDKHVGYDLSHFITSLYIFWTKKTKFGWVGKNVAHGKSIPIKYATKYLIRKKDSVFG